MPLVNHNRRVGTLALRRGCDEPFALFRRRVARHRTVVDCLFGIHSSCCVSDCSTTLLLMKDALAKSCCHRQGSTYVVSLRSFRQTSCLLSNPILFETSRRRIKKRESVKVRTNMNTYIYINKRMNLDTLSHVRPNHRSLEDSLAAGIGSGAANVLRAVGSITETQKTMHHTGISL
jgi:hypothetical protein